MTEFVVPRRKTWDFVLSKILSKDQQDKIWDRGANLETHFGIVSKVFPYDNVSTECTSGIYRYTNKVEVIISLVKEKETRDCTYPLLTKRNEDFTEVPIVAINVTGRKVHPGDLCLVIRHSHYDLTEEGQWFAVAVTGNYTPIEFISDVRLDCSTNPPCLVLKKERYLVPDEWKHLSQNYNKVCCSSISSSSSSSSSSCYCEWPLEDHCEALNTYTQTPCLGLGDYACDNSYCKFYATTNGWVYVGSEDEYGSSISNCSPKSSTPSYSSCSSSSSSSSSFSSLSSQSSEPRECYCCPPTGLCNLETYGLVHTTECISKVQGYTCNDSCSWLCDFIDSITYQWVRIHENEGWGDCGYEPYRCSSSSSSSLSSSSLSSSSSKSSESCEDSSCEVLCLNGSIIEYSQTCNEPCICDAVCPEGEFTVITGSCIRSSSSSSSISSSSSESGGCNCPPPPSTLYWLVPYTSGSDYMGGNSSVTVPFVFECEGRDCVDYPICEVKATYEYKTGLLINVNVEVVRGCTSSSSSSSSSLSSHSSYSSYSSTSSISSYSSGGSISSYSSRSSISSYSSSSSLSSWKSAECFCNTSASVCDYVGKVTVVPCFYSGGFCNGQCTLLCTESGWDVTNYGCTDPMIIG